MKKYLCLLLILLALCGCTSKENSNSIGRRDDSIVEEEVTTEDDFLTAPFFAKAKCDLKIYSNSEYPLTDSSWEYGWVRKGDYFEIYETKEEGNCIWSRIGNNRWIANENESLEILKNHTTEPTKIKLWDIGVPDKSKRYYYVNVEIHNMYENSVSECTYIKNSDGTLVEIDLETTDLDSNTKTHDVLKNEELNAPISNIRYTEGYYHEYDEYNNVIYQKDEYGNETSYKYKDGLLIEAGFPYSNGSDDYQTKYEYDEYGRMIQATDEYDQSYIEYNGNLIFINCENINFGPQPYMLRIDENDKVIEKFSYGYTYIEEAFFYE